LWCESCKSLCAMSVFFFFFFFLFSLFVCSDYQTVQIKGLAIHKTRDFHEDVNAVVNTSIIRPLYAYSGICFSSTVGKVELDHAPKSTKEHIELLHIYCKQCWLGSWKACNIGFKSCTLHHTQKYSTTPCPPSAAVEHEMWTSTSVSGPG
jgi:hypothetical protein